MKVGLIKGRHELPVELYVFEEIKDVTDYEAMEEHCQEFLYNHDGHIDLYVTGLTAATVAFINAAVFLRSYDGISRSVTLWHYDLETKTYKPQQLIRVQHGN